MLDPFHADYRKKSDYLVVAMNCHNAMADRYEWERSLFKFDCKKLFLFDESARWWSCGEGFHGWAKIVRKQVAKSEAKHVTILGSSMGGYGAIVIGAMLDLDCVVAFSPQTMKTKLYPKVSVDCRRALKKNLSGKTQYHIFYGDKNDEDTMHAQHIASFERVFLHPMDTDDHNVAKRIVRRGHLARIIKRSFWGWPKTDGSENLKKAP